MDASGPAIAVLHQSSTAVKVLAESNGGITLTFNGADDLDSLEINFSRYFTHFKSFLLSFNPAQVNRSSFNDYSAKSVTSKLAELLNKIVP